MRTAVFLSALVLGTGQQQPPANLPPSNRVTDPARPDFGYGRPWAGSELTIAIVLGADCKPCDASIPFYKSLVESPLIDGKTRRVVFLTQGGIFPVVDMVEKHPNGFRPSGVVSYPENDRFGTRMLPTVLVIDGTWKRRGEWVGKLTTAQEQEILALMSRISKEGRR